MKCCRLIIVAALFLSLGCGGGPSTTTTPKSSGSAEFAKLCRALGAEGGQITREQFLAKAKDKEEAARLFDACDANRDRLLSEQEAQRESMDAFRRSVIRMTTP